VLDLADEFGAAAMRTLVGISADVICSADVGIGIVLDNDFSRHLSTQSGPRVDEWAAANNVELACCR
jgi:hypothetical protein